MVSSNKKKARVAGLIYLGVVISGLIGLMYIPSKLIETGNALSTFQLIKKSAPLLRYWIISGLTCYTLFLFLPLALYRLLKPVQENIAKLMVILAILSVPVYYTNVQNLFGILSLITDANNYFGLSSEQIQTQVSLYLDQYNNGMRVIHIFSGLWLFPFGYLVYKSGFLPKLLGILLMLGCFGYLINFLGYLLFPGYSELGVSSYMSLPASLGEIGSCLWLLIVGAKNK